MNKFLLSLILLLTVTCNSQDFPTKELQGVWCGESNQCIYFLGSQCILYHAIISEYEFLSENEMAITSAFDSSNYNIEIEIEIDSIRIRQVGKNTFRTFYKPAKNNNKKIEELYYSQVSDFSKFEIYVNKDGRGVLEIDYHGKFDEGKYVATVPKTIIDFINELVNQMELDVPSKLDSRIISDIQEWGIKIKTDQTHYLYHNSEGVKVQHQRLAFLMNMLPHLLDLNAAESEISLDEIRNFRIMEFERNLKEYE